MSLVSACMGLVGIPLAALTPSLGLAPAMPAVWGTWLGRIGCGALLLAIPLMLVGGLLFASWNLRELRQLEREERQTR